jgi:hypothetical protein
MEWPFGARAGVESVAVAPVSGCFASDVVPSKNWTSPVTPGTVETTVAVNVTDVPNVDGFGADVTAIVAAAAVPLAVNVTPNAKKTDAAT